jgi:16S rRNA (cytosine967-C5)-methyltransferase
MSAPDSATLNHAARVLLTVAPDLPADAALRRYFLHSRRVGPREKRQISHAVFTYFRWWRWLDESQSAQKCIAQALALDARFTANPTAIKAPALAARAVPAWSHDEVSWPADTLRQLQRPPTLWLRARPGAAEQLAATLGHCALAREVVSASAPLSAPAPSDTTAPANSVPTGHWSLVTDHCRDALHYRGPQDLFLTPAFHAGAFEIQDLASQLVSLAAAPKPGETWWDACAGEGGKTLHLADLMANKGLLWASDRSARRLQTLKKRAARAHLFNLRTALWGGSARLPTKTKFDGILLDAPCSGLGTWQRNPHARWTTSPRDVAELAAIQRQLLENVAGSLKPGGRLVYAVCTLTRSETTAVAEAFSAAHPELKPTPVFTGSAETTATLWPHELSANGMFLAAWRKS